MQHLTSSHKFSNHKFSKHQLSDHRRSNHPPGNQPRCQWGRNPSSQPRRRWYLILRQSVVEPTQRAVVCAVVSIFGMVDIPIVYMANQWWRTQHPAPVLSGEGSLDPRMRFVLYFSFAALLFVFWCLVRMRRRIEHIRREMDALRREVHAL